MPSQDQSKPSTGLIGDYGFLSDCHSAALVDRGGSIDWWCVPRFDAPSVFGRLLDPDAGHWIVQPVGEFLSERRYLGRSLVIRTDSRTSMGAVSVTEALVLEQGARGHDIGFASPHALRRRVEGLRQRSRCAASSCPVWSTAAPNLSCGLWVA